MQGLRIARAFCRRRMAMLTLASAIGCCLMTAPAAHAGSAGPQAWYAACEKPYDPTRTRYYATDMFDSVARGVPWPAWTELMNAQWSRQAIEREMFYDSAAVARALALFPGQGPAPFRSGQDRPYTPQSAATPAQATAYDEAAQLYHAQDYRGAIRQFDRIVANRATPYRAAAAYSAARSALEAGDYDDGFARIQKITSDPALGEFHLAAQHLIGTAGWASESPALMAARFAEIRHMLTAPVDLVCARERLHEAVGDAGEDLKFLLNEVFRGPPWTGARRAALDALAQSDPWFDVLRAIAAPTSFDRANDWFEDVEVTAYGRHRLRAEWNASQRADALFEVANDSSALTAHTRERWLATKNLLWGYALARRTGDPQDIALIRDMIAGLQTVPDTAVMRDAVPALRWHFLRHGVRLLLMDRRIDEALAMIRSELPGEFTYVVINEAGFTGTKTFEQDAVAMVAGGTLLLVSQFDLPTAQHWSSEAIKLFEGIGGYYFNQSLKAAAAPWILTERFDEFRFEVDWQDRPLRQFMNLLPARRLIELSRQPNWTATEKRDLLTAGWMRLYLLGRWTEVKDLLPEMRAAYPELAADIDQIDAAWFDFSRRRLAARMILRAPGLSPWVIWARPGGQSAPRTASIFVPDTGNPSDGNWWCAADIDAMKLEVANAYAGVVAESKYPPVHTGYFFRDPRARFETPYLELADRIIAWHPLLKEIDFAELGALSKVDSGPRMLSEQAIRWADQSSWLSRFFGLDLYLPETLHLAVRSTRYGCRRASGHKEYSYGAFTRLHALYPDSEWARMTPYWFDTPGRWPAAQ